VIKIYGGMGNQLFQYFFGRYVESIGDGKVEIFYDVSYFRQKRKNHEFLRLEDLNLFWRDISESRVCISSFYTHRLLKRIPLPRNFKIFRESKESSIIHGSYPPYDAYYDGYWQSSKYVDALPGDAFLDLDRTVNRFFPSKYKNRDFRNSVSLHLRRGDYLTSKNHFPLGLDYYYNAVNYISQKINGVHFYIFSDDILWAKENLILNSVSVSFIEDCPDDLSEFSLMKNCSHHIIANSTFSWWAAWLGWQSTGGIVIAPKTWSKVSPTLRIYPDEWVVL